MTRTSRSLAVLASVSLTAGTLLGSIGSLQACPRSAITAPQNSVQQPAAPNSTTNSAPVMRQPESKSQPMNQAGMLGFGAIASLMAIGAYKLYQLRSQAALLSGAALLHHPALEHPELMLTSLPHEALPTPAAERELTLTR